MEVRDRSFLPGLALLGRIYLDACVDSGGFVKTPGNRAQGGRLLMEVMNLGEEDG